MVNETVKKFRQQRHQVLEQIQRLQVEAAKLGKAIAILSGAGGHKHAHAHGGSHKHLRAKTRVVWPEPPS